MEPRADRGQGSAMRCGTLDHMGYQQVRSRHKKEKNSFAFLRENKSANQNQRNCREGSIPDKTSCAMDCGSPMHCCCSSLPWHRAKYNLDKDHWTQAPTPSTLGRCSMCSTAQHSTAQHSTAQHQSCPVKVSSSQMIVSCMRRNLLIVSITTVLQSMLCC